MPPDNGKARNPYSWSWHIATLKEDPGQSDFKNQRVRLENAFNDEERKNYRAREQTIAFSISFISQQDANEISGPRVSGVAEEQSTR